MQAVTGAAVCGTLAHCMLMRAAGGTLEGASKRRRDMFTSLPSREGVVEETVEGDDGALAPAVRAPEVLGQEPLPLPQQPAPRERARPEHRGGGAERGRERLARAPPQDPARLLLRGPRGLGEARRRCEVGGVPRDARPDRRGHDVVPSAVHEQRLHPAAEVDGVGTRGARRDRHDSRRLQLGRHGVGGGEAQGGHGPLRLAHEVDATRVGAEALDDKAQRRRHEARVVLRAHGGARAGEQRRLHVPQAVLPEVLRPA
eukprot:CAMPEP_0175728494 /NCGR_PEP_ID=MMETSP0097-20121207/49328_1 /TAXON_ID=311494 /ORGANISM="Alexandrium monilatum, Strain CCMP3105" /LENGTH=257 /DNA_ID=CAMNT_0017036349 /DNA_START=133 /DNA_END=903 /DNA_ORIENTATION=-